MLKPLGDRIFLKKDEQLEKSGSIILIKKDGMHAPPYSGIITVLFQDLAGNEFKYDGNTVFSLREKDITAIIDKNIQVV